MEREFTCSEASGFVADGVMTAEQMAKSGNCDQQMKVLNSENLTGEVLVAVIENRPAELATNIRLRQHWEKAIKDAIKRTPLTIEQEQQIRGMGDYWLKAALAEAKKPDLRIISPKELLGGGLR